MKVDAIKSAWNKERLDEARIEVSAEQNEVSIHTEYPGHDHNFNFGNDDEHDNPASVEYTITVPRQAQLDKISLINGRLDLQDLAGEVHAHASMAGFRRTTCRELFIWRQSMANSMPVLTGCHLRS